MSPSRDHERRLRGGARTRTDEGSFASDRNTAPLLEICDLQVHYRLEDGVVAAVDGVDLTIGAGQIVGLVGESGCGKSATALAVLGVIDAPGRIVGGDIRFRGASIVGLDESEMSSIRGGEIGIVYQEPTTALNPVIRVGDQVEEAVRAHHDIGHREAAERTRELFEAVGIPDPLHRMTQYPHNLSGGLKQRVMITMALAGDPDLLIADEPTTALDVTVQAQILDLIGELSVARNMAVLFITHDLGVVAQISQRVAVMYFGKIVEEGPTAKVLTEPMHPYSAALLRSIPSAGQRGGRLNSIKGHLPDPFAPYTGCPFASRCPDVMNQCVTEPPPVRSTGNDWTARCWLTDSPSTPPSSSILAPIPPASVTNSAGGSLLPTHLGQHAPAQLQERDRAANVLEVSALRVWFPVKDGMLRRRVRYLRAVDDISFTVGRGETLGLVGESGCGKTTTGRAVLRLQSATGGSITFDGRDVLDASTDEMRRLRARMQIVFQDPYSSLDPRFTVSASIAEGLRAQQMATGRELENRVRGLLDVVGLEGDMRRRYPHELSGGQRQRVVIARALAVQPDFVVCDEAVSGLDVSVRAQILNLLEELQEQFFLTYLFISHDLAIVQHVSDRVAVMYLGKIVEVAEADELYTNPLHPYTRALLSAIPDPDPRKPVSHARLQGEVPSPLDIPTGCRFRPRCPIAIDRCAIDEPALGPPDPALAPPDGIHQVACHVTGAAVT